MSVICSSETLFFCTFRQIVNGVFSLPKISEANLSEEVKIFCDKLVPPGNFVANF